ncbi:unnamed protein product [Orchesella dallaii]|uniref:HMG box domain-containing protein n=1 Tax=Orchesella dallaii TaxID=48710 RepID=A0ABP1R5S1_9HEXA
MASVAGPSKPKAVPRNKKNGFYVFMEECKLATEKSLGFKLTMSDHSVVLSEDWKNMSAEEKKGYTSNANAALVAQKEAEQCKENGEIVWNMITEVNWTSQAIVVWCFTTYFEPALGDGEVYTPAEIGLTAFSLKNGLIENFALIVDPNGTIPTSKEFEALEQVDQLGIPAIGTYDELKHYDVLANTIKAFLEKNSDRGDRALYVFAFMSDLEKARKSVNEGQGAASGPVSLATLFTATNRMVGDPLNKSFIYHPAHPMTCYGVFPNETCVDDATNSSDNYKYCEELCCVYHMRQVPGKPLNDGEFYKRVREDWEARYNGNQTAFLFPPRVHNVRCVAQLYIFPQAFILPSSTVHTFYFVRECHDTVIFPKVVNFTSRWTVASTKASTILKKGFFGVLITDEPERMQRRWVSTMDEFDNGIRVATVANPLIDYKNFITNIRAAGSLSGISW